VNTLRPHHRRCTVPLDFLAAILQLTEINVSNFAEISPPRRSGQRRISKSACPRPRDGSLPERALRPDAFQLQSNV
jgi:hypothetical protein